jgi:phosphatidylinositol N-acetylglucosaminyltransferase subunit Q
LHHETPQSCEGWLTQPQSVPLSLKAMFYQYFQMGSRIRKHYLSLRVLSCLLTGRFVPPINRKNLYSLQYSMLPARRAGIWEMWDALKPLPETKKRFTVPFSASRPRYPNNYTPGGRTRHTASRGA